jgi:hypothetical protein
VRRLGSGTTGRPAERATPPRLTRFRYCRPPSCASDAARAYALRGPRVLRLLLGGAPAVIAGGGGGVGKEAVYWRQSGGMDMAKQRVFPPSLAPSPSAFPLRPASRPPSAATPACRQGPIPEIKPLGLGEGREGPGEARGALCADAVIPAGGAWGKPRSGQADSGVAAGRWQASHIESDAKRRPKQHRSAINQQVLIFIEEQAASSQHRRHTRCDSLFVSIDQRWPDIETQPNKDIPKPQVQKTMWRHEITVTKAVVT